MVHLAQTIHLPCTDSNTVSKQTKTRFHMTHVTKEFNRVRQKRFLSLRYVSLKSCTYLVSRFATSKRTKTSFHLSLVTTEYHWVRPKRYLSLWYVWRKSFTYLAPKLTLSPNGPKQDSTWPMLPMSPITCVENIFWAYGMFNANHATILRLDSHYLQID